jgi:hypothetical protein
VLAFEIISIPAKKPKQVNVEYGLINKAEQSNGIAISPLEDFELSQCTHAKKDMNIAKDPCHINDHEMKVIGAGKSNDIGSIN